MAAIKNYFHDHYILLLLSINIFLGVLLSVFVIVRLNSTNSANYIIQCRNCSDPNALNKYINGNTLGLVSFIVFSFLIIIISSVLSYRTHTLNKNLSIVILYIGILLEIVGLLVSNSLFVLR